MEWHDLPLVNGASTYIRREGKGQPLVMLHGMMATSDIWRFTLDAFKGHYQVIAPDLPGHGRSAGQARRYSLDYYVIWLNSLFDQLHLTSATLIGNSLGGAISLSYAMTYPHRVRRLILSDPLGLSDSLPWSAVANVIRHSPYGLLAVMTGRVDPYLLRYLRPWVFRDPWGSSYDAIAQMALLNLRRGFWSVGAGLQVVLRDFFSPRSRRDFLTRLALIDIPTLVIWGRYDGLLPFNSASAGLQRLKNAQVAVLEESSHSPMAEQPDEFNALVRKFLSTQAVAARK